MDTNFTIIPHSCKAGDCLPAAHLTAGYCHFLKAGVWHPAVGELLCDDFSGRPIFQTVGHAWLPSLEQGFPAISAPILTALENIASCDPLQLTAKKDGFSIAVITLSDKGSRGQRQDTAGPEALRLLKNSLTTCFSQNFLLPDNAHALLGLLAELALTQKYDLICTCGGTGVSPTDITPQTTRRLIDFELPGFSQTMLNASLAKTPYAAISRACCGVLAETLIINLPGSFKAVSENLTALLPALPHALAKLKNDPADCGG